MPVLMIGITLVVLDFFIVNVAMADIQRDLHATDSTLEWLVAGYGLAFASFLIAGGRLADRIGRRRVLALGIGLFGLASLVCGVAGSPELLIMARVLQGVGAALVSPTVVTMITALYDGADRRRALGIYGLVMGLAAVCGQLIGGLLLNADLFGWGWRTIFLINLPLAAGALLWMPRSVPESLPPEHRPVDVTGLAGVGIGLTLLLVPLLEGRDHGWPWWCWASFAAAAMIMVGVLLQQRGLAARGGTPLFAPEAFAGRPVRVGLLITLIYQVSQAPFYLFLALYLQRGRGMGPIGSGLTFSVLALGYLATSMRAPQLIHRYGRRVLLVAAALLVAGFGWLGAVLYAAGGDGTLQAPLPALLPGLLVVGLGQGLALNAITALVLAEAAPQHVGSVSGVMATVQQVGAALGVAVVGLVFFGVAGHHGFGIALAAATATLAGLMLLVAALAGLLPRRVDR